MNIYAGAAYIIVGANTLYLVDVIFLSKSSIGIGHVVAQVLVTVVVILLLQKAYNQIRKGI
ncbi:MAG: hypothetical protein Q7S50_01880 [bacterium]|nr:hypothetical protein [bacterium]